MFPHFMHRRPRPAAIVAIAATAALAGCVLSIEPAISPSEGVFQPGLLGTWVTADGKDSATVTRAGESGYRIRYIDDDGKPGTFDGNTGRLGKHLVLEVAPAAPEVEANDAYLAALLPGRLLFVIVFSGDGTELRTTTLQVDSLRAHLQHHDTWTPHLMQAAHFGEGDPDVLLTGTTAELRTWLAWYLDRPGVMSDPTVWHRVRQ